MTKVETQRLYLRPLQIKDLASLVALYSNPEVVRFLKDGKPRSSQVTEANLKWHIAHWQKHKLGYWAIFDKTTSDFIGCGGLYLDSSPEVNIGYTIDKAFWGRGIATEVALASLKFGIQQLGFNRVVAVVHPENKASQRVLEKVGLKYEKMVYHNDRSDLYFAINV